MPISDTFATFSSTRTAPSRLPAARSSATLTSLMSLRRTVKPIRNSSSCGPERAIRSTGTELRARMSSTSAARSARPLLRTSTRATSRSWVTARTGLVVSRETGASSSGRATTVPRFAPVELRTCTATCLRAASSTARECSTPAPANAISAITPGPMFGTLRAAGTIRGSAV